RFLEGDQTENSIGRKVLNLLKYRTYRFSAERSSKGRSQRGLSKILLPTAENLAEALDNLQRIPERFNKLNAYLRLVFPNVQDSASRNSTSTEVEVIIYTDKSENEEDAIALSDSGTGIGQVLAILCVLVSSSYSTTIIVDEPQGFLHPGAIHKLIDIFLEN